MPIKPIKPDPNTRDWADLDLGDAQVRLREYGDGMFALWVNEERILLDAQQMATLVVALAQLGEEKGWA